MTDNEIIKGLKTLLELVLYEGCQQRAKTISLAVDLINRQKAEIERLEEESIGTCELAVFMRNSDNFDLDCDYCIRKIKSEAIKEFAYNIEKAFEKTENQMPNSEIVKQTVQICRNTIQIVVKEMVGDNNG